MLGGLREGPQLQCAYVCVYVCVRVGVCVCVCVCVKERRKLR